MSRSSHHHSQRQQQKLQLHQQQQQQLLLAQQQQQIAADNEAAAAAAEIFDLFCVATTMRQILGLHRSMCDVLGLRPAPLNEFYPKVKAKVKSWKAQALWKKFDARAAHRAYAKGTASTGSRVLVIGAGPCGLRTAIEAQLLGAKVVVVEKRDRISRNNVLHLWPFVITDLRNLGAKKFYGKFCAGSIDHISIRQLQCILLKVALLLGVEIHEGVSFERTIEPSGDGCGWRASVTPVDHAVSHYEFDVLIGADGKRNTLEGFKRKEFRGKLAIAITANFINKKTEAEAKVEEISGVAFIFNQSFFKELYHTTGIDLENIVYYKDETHYFVMTAKKHSLIDKGVIIQDFADPAELLSPINVNKEKLLNYAREAADFSTKYQMPNLEFAVNHYGKPDVAMFDFTSMFAAETSCRVIVRKGFRLLQCLVGDSLLEPFWPTGSGCARGFLSSMDAAYALKLWSNAHNSTLGVLAQRESIYRLLNQTTPENLQRDIGSYTVDPATRYPNLNRSSVNVWQVKHLIDTDDKSILEQTFMDTNALQPTQVDAPVRRKRRSGDTIPLSAVLLRWICAQLHTYEFTKDLNEVADIFTNGKVICALINRYRPDLVDFNELQDKTPIECNELAFRILDKELHIPRVMSGKDSVQQLSAIDSKIWLNYLEQICEVFRGEIPHIKHPKMDFTELREKYRINIARAQPDFSKLLQISTKQKQAKTTAEEEDMAVDVPQQAATTTVVQRRSVLDEEKLKRQRKYDLLAASGATTAGAGAAGSAVASGGNAQQQAETPRRAKKRRSVEKATNIEERQQRLQEIEANRQDRLSRRRQQRYQQTQNFYKSLHMLQANTLLRESDESSSAFEDYSIFLYRQQAPEFNDRVKELERKLLYPDRERNDIPSAIPTRNAANAGAADEQFTDRIKSMEERMMLRNPQGMEKKPKDLLRAIGKIDSSDWNVREIEKKIEQSKRTEIHGPQGREKVPKWSKEQFLARQTKMSKPNRQNSHDEKFKEIDQTIKNLDRQLKEGNVLEVGERGRNKVASIAGNFVKKDDNATSDEKTPPQAHANVSAAKANSKVALNFKKQAASEKCHFCKQTVYLMEKLQTEGLTLHRSCLKCHHCHNNLRLGGYAFDRDDPVGRFYCTQHFRLPAKPQPVVVRKPGQRKPTQQQQQAAAAAAAAIVTTTSANVEPKTPDTKLRGHADTVAQLESYDRGQTPERIEFENTDAMSEPSEEHIIDEHEWSGRNFLPESNNDSESELTSSDESDSESDSDMFEEANDSPLGAQTLQLATDWIGKQNYSDSDDSDDFYDSSEGIVDDGKDDTDGEEFKKARELRREEVRLQPLPQNLPTDTETEVQSESETSPDEVELNSATEISTDSEFDQDQDIIRETPKIFIDDTHLKKPTKVQIKSTVITPSTQKYQPQSNANNAKGVGGGGSYLQKYMPKPQPQFKPLVQVDPTLLTSNRGGSGPLQNPRPGDYLLNKTASTEGIASKKSLELKKRYLLGEPANGNKIQKSGSTSVLDSKIRSFKSNISECQKLLNPSSDISPSMKTFLDRTKLGEVSKTNSNNSESNDLMRSATTNILNDLKVEITIQKANSGVTQSSSTTNTTSINNNNVHSGFVNSKNELNKGMELSETMNTALLESYQNKKSSVNPPATPTNNKPIIIETIDLITPEKEKSSPQSNIELTKVVDLPLMQLMEVVEITTDSNKLSNALSNDRTIIDDVQPKPDVSMDVKERPDILKHCENEPTLPLHIDEDRVHLLHQRRLVGGDGDEKCDSPEKMVDHSHNQQYEHDTVQIEVPNIPWHTHKNKELLSSTTTASSCSSHSSSVEDIQHFILESTTSPDTHNSAAAASHQVPRLEIHDSSGTLMQTLIDGETEGEAAKPTINSESLVPEVAAVKTSEVDEDVEVDIEPVTATPEPAECTVIEAETETGARMDTQIESADEAAGPPPLPPTEPPKMFPTTTTNLKFDTKNENKVQSLSHLPLIVESNAVEQTRAIKPATLSLASSSAAHAHKSPNTPNTPTALSPLVDNDKTPTADLMSRGSDSETECTGTGHVLTETELSDWTADDCISENFIDMEYALNSNSRGTMRRNTKKGSNKKHHAVKLLNAGELQRNRSQSQRAPVAQFIDIDDIEFMDTGSSEGSCAEAYAATNTALLQNRGYMEFIETTAALTPTPTPTPPQQHTPSHKAAVQQQTALYGVGAKTKRDEKLGIDYIEQGAYILHSTLGADVGGADVLKTPVNECPPHLLADVAHGAGASGGNSLMTQSLTDSSTLNELDEDSLYATATKTVTTATNTTTTEESEALTIVTSPPDSSSPKTRGTIGGGGGGGGSGGVNATDANATVTTNTATTHRGSETPSSSEKNPKTSQSTEGGTHTPTSSLVNSSNTSSPPRGMSTMDGELPVIGVQGAATLTQRKPSSDEQLSYEEYVRVLQQKIAQISTARDSLETRKQRRKSSKGDASQPAVSTTSGPVDDSAVAALAMANSSSDVGGVVHKVPEIPTLTRKLEEITKERTKQKDLIHDLVMDKLQSKKQLNAEKRLHRSRQRTMLTSGGGGGGGGYASGSSGLSPTPKIPAAASTTDTNCTSKAHYHVSTAAGANNNAAAAAASSFKENTPLQRSATYISAYGMKLPQSPTRALGNANRQRPFSAHLDGSGDVGAGGAGDGLDLEAYERYKLSKTASCAANAMPPPQSPLMPPLASVLPADNNNYITAFATPLAQAQPLSVSTENLRSEARARARLKSNSELGLSPEEKMQLLRKRLYAANAAVAVAAAATGESSAQAPSAATDGKGTDLERQLEARQRKMSASKSVNDLAYLTGSAGAGHHHVAVMKCNNGDNVKHGDFTSDLNLLLSSNTSTSSSSTAAAAAAKSAGNDKHAAKAAAGGKANRNHRQKEPERRKSLIQSLSSFFHKSSGSTAAAAAAAAQQQQQPPSTTSAGHSAQPERSNTGAAGGGGSGGNSNVALNAGSSSSIDGMFSRFRISPKSKQKSKSCFDVRNFGFGDKDGSNGMKSIKTSPTTPTTTTPTRTHERSNSQNCIYALQQQQQQQHNSKHTNYAHRNNNNNNKQQHSDQQQQHKYKNTTTTTSSTKSPPPTTTFSSSSPQLYVNKSSSTCLASAASSSCCANAAASSIISASTAALAGDEQLPPPIPPLPLNYQRSDDESYATTAETRDQKKQRAITRATRQAELKRLRIAQEIQREQEEIEVELKELEARGVCIEKALRGEAQNVDNLDLTNQLGSNDEKLLKELLDIWRNITQLKKRDEELGIRQQELQLEHRHAQLKEELNLRLSCNKLDKSSADVAAEGAILNEMLEIVARRAALRPTINSNSPAATTANHSSSLMDLSATHVSGDAAIASGSGAGTTTATTTTSGMTIHDGILMLTTERGGQTHDSIDDNDESHI